MRETQLREDGKSAQPEAAFLITSYTANPIKRTGTIQPII